MRTKPHILLLSDGEEVLRLEADTNRWSSAILSDDHVSFLREVYEVAPNDHATDFPLIESAKAVARSTGWTMRLVGDVESAIRSARGDDHDFGAEIVAPR